MLANLYFYAEQESENVQEYTDSVLGHKYVLRNRIGANERLIRHYFSGVNFIFDDENFDVVLEQVVVFSIEL